MRGFNGMLLWRYGVGYTLSESAAVIKKGNKAWETKNT